MPRGCYSDENLTAVVRVERREESPQSEMAHTAIFLASKGLVLPDRHAVARYARLIGEDRRRELLIFYHEVTMDR